MLARFLLVAVAGLGFVAPVSASIITNGSFESGVNPGSFAPLSAGSGNITGWNITAGSIDYIGTYWNASDGARSVDLNGLNAGTISQVFTTTPGQVYEVTFDLSGNPDGSPTVKTLTASAGSFSGTFSFDVTGQSRPNISYAPQSFQFTATGTSTTLSFASTSGASAFGPVLDNVSVTAVPEPATLAVLAFGVFGAGLYTRRRKVAAANA